ncbi:MAG: ankyrin repeat domain-containing protein [Acidimicrobiales bacterium]
MSGPRPGPAWLAAVVAIGGLAGAACSPSMSSSSPAPATMTSVSSSVPSADPPAGAPADDAGRALLDAAGRGDTAAARRLLADGAPVDPVDAAGRTPLVVASYAADLELAGVLVEAGADVNHQDRTKQSAYLIATSEIGPDDGLALLGLTLANGADVAAKDSFNGTGLIRAAHRGYADIVDELLRAGIEVDHVNGLGWTALLEAIILGDGGADHTRVVQLLLDAGADPGLADNDGVTPLAHARARSFDAIAGALTAAGATA